MDSLMTISSPLLRQMLSGPNLAWISIESEPDPSPGRFTYSGPLGYYRLRNSVFPRSWSQYVGDKQSTTLVSLLLICCHLDISWVNRVTRSTPWVVFGKDYLEYGQGCGWSTPKTPMVQKSVIMWRWSSLWTAHRCAHNNTLRALSDPIYLKRMNLFVSKDNSGQTNVCVTDEGKDAGNWTLMFDNWSVFSLQENRTGGREVDTERGREGDYIKTNSSFHDWKPDEPW